MSNLNKIIDGLTEIKELNLHLEHYTDLVKNQLTSTFNDCNNYIMSMISNPDKNTYDMLVILGLHIAQDMVNRMQSAIGLYETGAIDKNSDIYTDMVKSVQSAIDIACSELMKTLTNISTCTEDDAKRLIDELHQSRK